MDIKKINEELEKLITYEPDELNLESFMAFLKKKGYDHKPIPPSIGWNGYKVTINGYALAINVSGRTRWKEGVQYNESVVTYAPLGGTGYARNVEKSPMEFNSIEEYYEYAFDEILDFVNKKLDEINASRQRKQKIKDQVNNLKNGDKLELTLQELQDLLKSKPMSITTKVTIELA